MVLDGLPLAQELALAHAGKAVRPVLAAFLELDQRLAQFVSQAKEPILTQMRIAWWRDQLGKPPLDRPQGDPTLDTLSQLWSGEEAALIDLVNGWEGLLAEPPLPEAAATDFATGRGACFAAIARLVGSENVAAEAAVIGNRWAMGDLASRMSSAEEQEFVVGRALAKGGNLPRLPRTLRSLAILGRLGDRSLARGGGPLISGRSDVLLVSRLGLFGR